MAKSTGPTPSRSFGHRPSVEVLPHLAPWPAVKSSNIRSSAIDLLAMLPPIISTSDVRPDRSEPDQGQPRFLVHRLLQVARRLDDDHLQRRPDVGLQQVAAEGRAV